VARVIRQGKVDDVDELVAAVRSAANAFIAETATTQAAPGGDPTEETRMALGELNSRDREILRRSYNLRQAGRQVSREMGVPLHKVIEVKRRARRRFLPKRAS
jgi:hypothetical protein